MKKIKKLWANPKSEIARSVVKIAFVAAPLIAAFGCKHEPTPCTDYTNPDCPNYDPCWQAKQDYNTANDNYLDARRQCLQVYLPQCFDEITGFKANYDMYLLRDDSLLTVQTVVNAYIESGPQYLVGHEALADSAKQTSIKALNLEAMRDSVYNANQNCLQ